MVARRLALGDGEFISGDGESEVLTVAGCLHFDEPVGAIALEGSNVVTESTIPPSSRATQDTRRARSGGSFVVVEAPLLELEHELFAPMTERAVLGVELEKVDTS